MARITLSQANSWMVAPSATMTVERTAIYFYSSSSQFCPTR